jgi:hypothetical protein
MGAISRTAGVYILPGRADCLEGFQWLAQEVEQAGGEALVMRVGAFEGMMDADLIEHFQTARQKEYSELDRQATALAQSVTEAPSADERLRALEGLEKLRKRHAEVARIDFFNSPAGASLAAKLTQLGQRLVSDRTTAAQVEPADPAAFKGKTWVTRPKPHVDRLACIWLIRRFIDREATVRYRETAAAGEVSFDMTGARFGHVGNLCTFETMVAAFGLEEPALQVLAELVHELDLRDGRYARPEAAGIDAVLEGWRQHGLRDEDLEAHGTALFEGLYSARQATFGETMKHGEATKHETGHLHKGKR